MLLSSYLILSYANEDVSAQASALANCSQTARLSAINSAAYTRETIDSEGGKNRVRLSIYLDINADPTTQQLWDL